MNVKFSPHAVAHNIIAILLSTLAFDIDLLFPLHFEVFLAEAA